MHAIPAEAGIHNRIDPCPNMDSHAHGSLKDNVV